MKITAEQAIDLLSQEIQWCIANPDKAPSPDFREGFIEGLEQAKRILRAAEHPRPLQTTSSRVLFLRPIGAEEEVE